MTLSTSKAMHSQSHTLSPCLQLGVQSEITKRWLGVQMSHTSLWHCKQDIFSGREFMAISALTQYSPSSRFLCFLPSQFPPCVLSNYSFFSHSSSTSPSIRTPSILYTFTYVCLFIYVHLYTCHGNHLPSSKFFPLSKPTVLPLTLHWTCTKVMGISSSDFTLLLIQPPQHEVKTSPHHRLCSSSCSVLHRTWRNGV